MSHSLSYELVTAFAPLQPVDATGILIHQAPDLFALWGAIEEKAKCVCNPPFWGIVWPGARLCARYLFENRPAFAGKTVLDIGSGCGFVAIAALMAGVRNAIANDIDTAALSVAMWNAAANDVRLSTDNRNLVETAGSEIPDVVFAADMFYEATVADPLYALLYDYHIKGSEVFIADGNRPFTPRDRLTLCATATFDVNEAVEGKAKRVTSLYRLTAHHQ
jgi:predicted nicotinamide N-methyase